MVVDDAVESNTKAPRVVPWEPYRAAVSQALSQAEVQERLSHQEAVVNSLKNVPKFKYNHSGIVSRSRPASVRSSDSADDSKKRSASPAHFGNVDNASWLHQNGDPYLGSAAQPPRTMPNLGERSSGDGVEAPAPVVCAAKLSDVVVDGANFTNGEDCTHNEIKAAVPVHFMGDVALLRDELETQKKVSRELKQLLVATMGEDLPIKLECLSYDKAVLGRDVEKYTSELSREAEASASMAIESDLWRSKFLASSLMIDELQTMQRGMVDAYVTCQRNIRDILQERCEIAQILQAALANLKRLRPLEEALVKKASAPPTVTDLAFAIASSSASLTQRLGVAQLPEQNRSVRRGIDRMPTGPEVRCREILTTSPFEICKKSVAGRASTQLARLQSDFRQLTFNCCAKCNGPLHVV